MDLKTCYKALGGNYSDVLGRLPSEKLIKKLLLKFPEDPSCSELCYALERGDRETAFRSAHNLKGICLNLSFTALLESSSALTEALRPGTEYCRETADSLFADVIRDYNRILTAVKQLEP